MKNVVIWGCGNVGKELIAKLATLGIDNFALVDSNEEVQGGYLLKKKIENPTEIKWENVDMVVVAVGEQWKDEICNILINEYKISREKIMLQGEYFALSAGEIYNFGNKELQLEKSEILSFKEIRELLDIETLNELEKFFYYGEHKVIAKWVHYFDAYDRFFSKYVGKDVAILEIGVSKGGSMQMWKDYFKKGNNKVRVYGIDIDPKCKLLEEDGIEIFIGSQEDREFLRKVKAEIGKVDILIDDGGHTMTQQIITFEELFDLVADDGVYLCEDLHTSYWENYGGGYKKNSFIEYSKNLIDYINAQHSETGELVKNLYTEQIKYITYCDSMMFVEKKKKTTRSMGLYTREF